MQKVTIVAVLLISVAFAHNSEFNFGRFTQSMNFEVNSKQTTWVSGHNSRFDGMSYEQIQALMGLVQVPSAQKVKERAHFTESELLEMALPENYNPQDTYPQCESMKEVRDQSNCGSCWAFGTVEAASDRICLASGQKNQTKISSEDLLSCCVGLLSCGFGCNGGNHHAAWNYFKKTGLVTGNLYEENQYCQPYAFPPCNHHVQGSENPDCSDLPVFKTPKCSSNCNAAYGKSFSDDKHFARTAYTVPKAVEQIQAELYKYGSATAAMNVYEDFLTYTGGVYQHTSGKYMGGHAIKIMGWGVENGTPYWLCANSWNTNWGEHGFFKILRGQNEVGIEADIAAGLVEGQQE